ncbi:MAG TPA: GDSL-type esterase/lipase family protein [Candidatus Saccharimonadales bacterium]|nr:GDSL-type esterase/lipase family protein [Candidatus Saccharimonadales bacterium]
MKRVFLFGDSFVHGTGGAQGGWAACIKATLHREMFGEDAVGEQCRIFELGISGSTTTDLLTRLEPELKVRLSANSIPDDIIIVFQIGTNDTKANDSPHAFVTTPEVFEKNVRAILQTAKQYAGHVIVLGLPPVDERKVRPKRSLVTGGDSYFSNARSREFENIWQKACQETNAIFVPMHDAVPEVWIDRCLFTDGLHPNDQGHQWIANQLEPHLRKAIGDWQ